MAVRLDSTRNTLPGTQGGAAKRTTSKTDQASAPQSPSGTPTQSTLVASETSVTKGPNGTTTQSTFVAAQAPQGTGAPGSKGQSSFVAAQASVTQGPNGTTVALSATSVGPGGWKSFNVINQLKPQGPANKDFDYRNGIYNCGGAVAAMVARGLGNLNHLSDAELITQLSAGITNQNGTSLKGMGKMLERAGARLGGDVLAGGYEDSAVKEHLDKGNKLIARVGLTDKETGKTDGHYVLVDGMDDKGNYIVKDPLKEQAFTVTPEELRAAVDNAPGAGGALVPVQGPKPGAQGEYRAGAGVVDRFDKDGKGLRGASSKFFDALDPFKVDAKALQKSGLVEQDFDESVADIGLDSGILRNDKQVDNDLVGSITAGSEDGGKDLGRSITGERQSVQDMVDQVMKMLASPEEADTQWGRWLLESLEQSRSRKDRQAFSLLQEMLAEQGGVGARMWLESLN